MTTQSAVVARTPLHNWHAARGARFVSSDGWQIPAVYTSLEEELAAARTGVVLADVSAFAKLSLVGHGVPALTRTLLGETLACRPRGFARFDAGGPVLACRLAEDRLLLLTATTIARSLKDRLVSLLSADSVLQNDATSAYAGIYLAGAQSEKVVHRLTSLDISSAGLPEGSCAETGLAGIQALLVRPPGDRFHAYVFT